MCFMGLAWETVMKNVYDDSVVRFFSIRPSVMCLFSKIKLLSHRNSDTEALY